jgi:DNA-binding CsgD family transcriptional regulator
MSPACRALASAVAVLGDRALLGNATRLAGLQPGAASEAADALAAVQLLNPGVPLSFVHPVIRSAVLASMPPLARGRAHRQAAIILREEGAPIEVVAGHLLVAPAACDPTVVEALRVAARDTIGSGEHETAARLLERALAEQPPPSVYPELLAELGQAEALAGLPHAPLRLEEAISAAEEPQRRAELALAQGRALVAQESYADGAAALAGGLGELSDAETPLVDELSSAFISAASHVPHLVEQALDGRREMLGRLDNEPNAGQRRALAHTVIHDSLRGGPRSHVRELADLAWSDGALLDAGPAHDTGFSALTSALLVADELERDLEISDAALALARDRESPLARATASHSRAWALYERGQISEAAADAKAALDAPGEGPNQVRTAYGALACCHMLTGQLDRAERALTIVDDEGVRGRIRHPFLVDVRAQLRLAQHRPREALADAMLAGRVLESTFGVTNPGVVAWRSTAALAHLALGEPAAAENLAAEELELAQRAEVTRAVIRNLRILGLATGGASGIELLGEAARFARSYPTRLESVYALVDLGAALRRAKKRAAARTPLHKGLELSRRHGATALARRAEIELAASGARSRRAFRTGVDALTPSERRVAELAGEGLTTRQIAETLFVTPKTIEFHLRHIYRKLDVNSRSQLADLLTANKRA